MQLILSHINTDFDSLGAMVGARKLYPQARLVLAGAQDRNVRDYLTLHEEFLDLLPARQVDPGTVSRVIVVETQSLRRLGELAGLVLAPRIEVILYDHHIGAESDIPARERHIEPFGAATTLLVREIRARQGAGHRSPALTPLEATTMLLGIYEDTGSLSFSATTPEDLEAAAWLLRSGASLDVVSRFVNRALTPEQRELLNELLARTEYLEIRGVPVAIARSDAGPYVDELALLAHKLSELENVPLVFVLARMGDAVYVVGRARSEVVHVGDLLSALGGGGHSRAASAVLHGMDVETARARLLEALRPRVRREPVAREIMSVPARTVSPDASMAEARSRMIRYGHSGLSVVEDGGLVGVITRRDVDKARHHRLSHAPVKGFMTRQVVTAEPGTSISEMERRMIERDVGRLPVVEDGRVVGVVTRGDLLRARCGSDYAGHSVPVGPDEIVRRLEERLPLHIQEVLHQLANIAGNRGQAGTRAAGDGVRGQAVTRGAGDGVRGQAGTREPEGEVDRQASDRETNNVVRDPATPSLTPDQDQSTHAARGYPASVPPLTPETPLFLVGGFVRDLLLDVQNLDIDLVVEGDATRFAAEVARRMHGRLKGHHQFATATVTLADGLKLDFSTARSETYGQPGALPEVEASSIEDDLKRRDFTINAMAIRVSPERFGQLLDPMGGRADLERGVVRVLHNLSFYEDPTRIFRAVRFEARYAFRMDAHTEALARHALAGGVLDRVSPERLRRELHLLFAEPNPLGGLRRIEDLGILEWLSPGLSLHLERLERVEGALAWVARLSGERPDRGVVYLATLLADRGAQQAAAIAERRLRLSDPKRELLRLCLERLPCLLEQLSPPELKPHAIYRALSGLPPEALTLIRIWQHEPLLDARLELYLTQLRGIRLEITGDDLRAAGVSPGPAMGEALRRTLDARLDGELTGRDEELAYALRVLKER